MAKIYNYLTLLAGITVLLTFAGIQTGIGSLLSSFGLLSGTYNVASSTVFVLVGAVLVVATAVGIRASFFGSTPTESFIMGGLATAILYFVLEYVTILNYINGTYGNTFVSIVFSAVFIPLIIGFVISVVDWWRGSDG